MSEEMKDVDIKDEEEEEEFDSDCIESPQSESDSEMETEENVVTEEAPVRRTYIPTAVDNTEELEFDESAYIMYRKAETEYPCLSFDIINDNLGSGAERADNYPLTCHLVAGTQSGKSDKNKLLVLRMSNLNKIKPKEEKEDSDDSSDSSDDEEEDEPKLDCIPIDHKGCVNRVRSTTANGKSLCASWSESGTVYIWNLTQAISAFDDSELMTELTRNKSSIKSIYNFSGHRIEGYGLDWSPLSEGLLATGDCKKNIFIWKPTESGVWAVDQKPLIGHKESVEDLQWSPSEDNVLASCSVDKSIRIWDIRAKPASCMLAVESAHESDINVISWNQKEKTFICSGGDDGVIKIWDLRQFKSKSPKPIATFKHHISHITSVEWHPTDGTVFAASGDDNQLTLWDLAVEKDSDNQIEDQTEVNELPPQLLFIHQGQTEIKELHWHKQIPGLVISTASNGIDLFRTISV